MRPIRKVLGERVLWILYYFALGAGIITFRIYESPHLDEERDRAVPCRWYTWFSIGLRFACVAIYYYSNDLLPELIDSLLDQLTCFKSVSIIVCSLGLIVLQVGFIGRFVEVTSAFFRLFRRVHALAPQQDHLIGTYHTVLVAIKLFWLFYELALYTVPTYLNFKALTVARCLNCLLETYLTIGICTMLHVCFVGYIGVSVLYEKVNSYLLNDFRTRLQWCDYRLKRKKDIGGGGTLRGRHSRKLSALSAELSACGALLDDIADVGRRLHSLLEVPVLYTIFFSFSGLSVIIYSAIWDYHITKSIAWDRLVFIGKIFSDILLLTLAAHSAIKNSQLVKRMSLDSALATTDHQEWEATVETFLNRYNLREFKLHLLGLFDLSNEMNLIYLSGIVTYLTYILQSSIQRQIL